jgi:excisionase family DNA binding protein
MDKIGNKHDRGHAAIGIVGTVVGPGGIVGTLLGGTLGLPSIPFQAGPVVYRGTLAESVVMAIKSPSAKKASELFPPGLGLIEGVEAHTGPWLVAELALYLRQSKGSIYQAIREGRLPAIKTTGATIRICPKAAGQWLRDRMTVPDRQPLARQGKRTLPG